MANIKKVQLPGQTSEQAFEIEALHFIASGSVTLDTPAQWKQYIDDAVAVGIQIVKDEKHATKDEPATAASASTMGKIYIVDMDELSGTYTEFITLDTVDGDPRYVWEKIGTTEADLSNYVTKGTYTTFEAGEGNTGSAGACDATLTASVTYDKATVTESAGAHTHGVTFNTRSFVTGVTTNGTVDALTSVSVASTFTAVKGITTTSGTVGISGGEYDSTTKYAKVTTVAAGTDTAVKSITTTTNTAIKSITAPTSNFTYTAASLGTPDTTNVVTGYANFTGGTLTTKNYGFTTSTSVFTGATVNAGVLSWTSTTANTQDAYTAASLGTASTTTVVTGYSNFNGGTVTGTKTFVTSVSAAATDTFVTGVAADATITVTTEGIKSATLNVAATSSTGAQAIVTEVSGSAPELTGDTVFLKTAVASGTDTAVKSITSTTASVIKSDGLTTDTAVTGGIETISAGGHTHSVTTTPTVATVTGTAAVANHTHTIGNHTHNINL